MEENNVLENKEYREKIKSIIDETDNNAALRYCYELLKMMSKGWGDS